MRVFFLKIVFFVVFLFFGVADVSCVDSSEIHASVSISSANTNCFNCKLESVIPDGWKLSKPPKVINTNDTMQVAVTNNNQMTTHSKNSYESSFSLEFPDLNVPSSLSINVEYFLCSDACCTIITKELSIQIRSERTENNGNLLFFILIGILGGMILNIMPCVLPVIFMKLRALKNADKTALFGSIAGNYTTFSLIAVCLAILKVTGNTVGWGMHFQNIYFLKITTIVVFLLMLYSFGVITISPSMEMKNSTYSAFTSSFISSIVSSIIAIPCTGPFLGTAAAFAIQGSIRDMIVIFLAIATGFSAPYFLAFFTPKVASFNLGKYSNIFKQVINLGISLTFLWMFWLLASRLSLTWIGIYVVSFTALWACFSKGLYKLAVGIFSVFFVFAITCDASSIKPSANVLQEVRTLVNKNKTVVFTISADWCLTCKYNDLKIFSNEDVSKTVKQFDVQIVHGDLTEKSEELMKFIHSFGRVGIPFMIIYGPNAKSGILLDEMPSVADVIKAIETAAGSAS